jgi:hypothetical protein
MTHIDINAEGTGFDYALEYAVLETGTYRTSFQIDGNGYSTIAVLDSEPTDGPQDPGFLDVPELIAPASRSDEIGLHDRFEWTTFDTGLEVLLIVRGDTTDKWMILAPTDATTIRVPSAPSTVDETALLGTDNLNWDLVLERRPAGSRWWSRLAAMHAIGTVVP